MKVVLDKTELNYLYGLFKLLASGVKDLEHKSFYTMLADKVSPDRLYCNLNQAEAKLLLDIVGEAKLQLTKVLRSDKADTGSILRADTLSQVMDSAMVKLNNGISRSNLTKGDDEYGV